MKWTTGWDALFAAAEKNGISEVTFAGDDIVSLKFEAQGPVEVPALDDDDDEEPATGYEKALLRTGARARAKA